MATVPAASMYGLGTRDRDPRRRGDRAMMLSAGEAGGLDESRPDARLRHGPSGPRLRSTVGDRALPCVYSRINSVFRPDLHHLYPS